MGVSRPVGRRTRRRGGLTRVQTALLPLSAAILPAIVYLRTMPPTVYGLDSAELSVGAYTLGLVHSPGYPLYLLLGKLFTLLPVGDVGYRLNLMSAAFGIVTILLVYDIARRLTRQSVIALAAALFLAFSWYFWTDAIVAEVYTLQAAFTAGLLWLLLIWRERRERRWLYVFALAAGLSCANYPATGLIAPGLAAFVWLTDRRLLLSPRQLATLAGLFGLGFLVYLYLPLRYLAVPAFNYMGSYDAAGNFHPADLTDPVVLWQMFTGGPFQGLMFGYSASEAVRQAGRYLYFLWGNFLAVGLPLGLLGLAHGWRRDRPVALSTGLMYLVYVLFFINYRVVDKHTMFLPGYVIWAVWIAWGLDALLEWTGRTWRSAMQVAFLAIAAIALLVNFPLADVSWDRRAYENAADMLAAAAPDALILGDWGYAAPITYLQLAEGRRPDVQVINRFFISFQDMRQLIDESVQSRPVYTVSVEPDIAIERLYEVEAAGPGFRILSRNRRQ
ncbi:MAG: protein O-mannosyl-transferase family [Anaerolineae bacterium]